MNWNNCRVMKQENSYEFGMSEQGNNKVNLWCIILMKDVASPFFFEKVTVTGHVYLQILGICLISNLNTIIQNTIYFQ